MPNTPTCWKPSATTGKFEDDTKAKVVDALKTFAKQFA